MKTHKRLRKVTHESTVPRTTERCSIGGMWIVVLIIGWLVVTPAALTAANAAKEELSAHTLKIGWAEADITPDKPVQLTGLGSAVRITDAVKDPLKATVLAQVRSGPASRGPRSWSVSICYRLRNASATGSGSICERSCGNCHPNRCSSSPRIPIRRFTTHALGTNRITCRPTNPISGRA